MKKLFLSLFMFVAFLCSVAIQGYSRKTEQELNHVLTTCKRKIANLKDKKRSILNH